MSLLRSRPVQPIEIYIGCQSPNILRRIRKWRTGRLVLLTPPCFSEDALSYIRKGYNGKNPGFPELDSINLCPFDTDENGGRKSFAKFIIHILRYLAEVQLKISLDYGRVASLE